MKAFVLLIFFAISSSVFAQTAVKQLAYVPVTKFDPARNADEDIRNAVAEAQRTGRHIILDIGGNWCVWCTYFDKFFDTNISLHQFLDENYIVVKVNFSRENKNEAVISRYGPVPGYPHLFVLNSDGKLLHSQDTSPLESGRGYSVAAITEFLHKWAPKKKLAQQETFMLSYPYPSL